MAEETPMFERIINRIGERSETTRLLRASDEAFKTMLSGALGDAAPEDGTDAAGFVAGVKSLQKQLTDKTEFVDDAASRIREITKQRTDAYNAERAATKRADDLLAEQQLIAEKLGLLETEDDEPADAVNAAADTITMVNPGGQTDSDVGAAAPDAAV